MNRRTRVAFVVQRCGREVNGGAESLCLQLADRMSAHWDTEVLTTCALGYMQWENHYPPGLERIGGTSVRRFRVDEPRDVERFNLLSDQLQRNLTGSSIDEQEKWMRAQGPMSQDLFRFLAEEKEHYDAFVFFTYLYATTYFGLPLVKEKAYLAPLGHDEWPVYLSMWDRFFVLPRRLVFSTEAERKFLRARFPALPMEGEVVALGIERPAETQPELFRRKYGLDDPFLLYVGRIDESKGCAEMFDFFIRRRAAGGGGPCKLVLIGTEVLPVPFHDDIIHLGFVDEAEKWQAMAACDWLLIPSVHESLSMVLLETWSVERPAIVNGGCEVLRAHCEQGHAGLWYESEEEWNAILDVVTPEEQRGMGRRGSSYVRHRYSWERVEQDYRALIEGGIKVAS